VLILIRNKSKNKVNKLVALFAILALFSCQTQTPQKIESKSNDIAYSKNILDVEKEKKETIKPVVVSSASVIPNINLVSPQQIKDEEEIKSIIEKEIDLSFFNTDDDDSLEATVPNNGGVVFATVPNNGGVVFFTDSDPTTLSTFSTKAILNNQTTIVKNIREEVKENIKENVKETIKEVRKKRPRLTDIIPAKWGKKIIGKPKKEVKIEFNKENTQANVTVTSTSDIEMRLEKANNPLVKKLQEILKVTAVFVKEGKAWKLSKVSKPESVDAKNEAKIEIASVKMTVVSKDKTSKIINVNLKDLQSKDEFPTLENGDIVTLEVKAINTDPNSDDNLNVFAKLSNAKVRIPLSDDGSQNSLSKEKSERSTNKDFKTSSDNDKKETSRKKSGDLVKDDDIYTANIGIKAKKGTNYLVITAVTDGSFESASNFLSISKSIPFNIK
jgi:hypothetical protein